MKSRSEIKSIAKQSFSNRYWPCVGIFIVFGILLSALGSTLIFTGPVYAGITMYAVNSYRGDDATFKVPFTGRIIGGGCCMLVFECLWSMLFIIPGIIKSYSYSLTPYILGFYPNVKATKAITLSRRIMNGHKWELFVMQLSFIGWFLLSCITFGIVDIFYASPYYQLSIGGYYDELVNNAIATGIVSQDELDGKVEIA